jgi:hypothetical protein
MLYYSSGVLWPIQIQVLYATKPITIGLYAIGLGLAGAMGAPIAGFIMASADQARWQFTVFTALLTIVSGCQAIVGMSKLELHSPKVDNRLSVPQVQARIFRLQSSFV